MKFTLKHYQQTAVTHIQEKVYSFLQKQDDKKRIVTLKAPTGSGKTVIMAGIIESLVTLNKDEDNIDFTFLWLSIGKGELHIQSKRSLENMLGQSVLIQSIDEVFGTTQHVLLKDSVLVSSWDKIRARDGQTQEWKNIVMKDGDNTNFREMLDNTKIGRNKIILIIDESHSHAKTGRALEIIDLIQPNVIIEVSATPTVQSGDAVELYKEEIEAQDVIDEEMIKDQILVNPHITSYEQDDSDETVLRTAIQKRDELEKLYKENNIDVNPLILIQLPNSRDGEEIQEMVLKFLEKNRGISAYDPRVAIWLDSVESKNRNIIGISKNNAPQQFLLFKQAVDTGWDCPRAQILLKFREVKSEVFEIQILGRILRMPEQKHYTSEALNKAYVYVNSREITFDIEHYGPNILGDKISILQDVYKSIGFNSFYKERADYQDIKGDFKGILTDSFVEELGLETGSHLKNIDTLVKQGWKFTSKDLYHDIAVNIVKDVSSIDKYGTPIEDDDYERRKISSRQIEISSKHMFAQMMSPFTNRARSIPTMNVAWFSLCNQLFGPDMVTEDFLSSQTILMLNYSKIEPIFLRAVQKYSLIRQKKAKENTEHSIENFEITSKDYFNSEITERSLYDKHVLQPCYLNKNRSEPEKEFEKILEKSKNILWWYKNGEMRKDYFGIRYEFDNLDSKDTTHTFYPDYIVKYVDHKIGIFETKSKEDRDVKTKPKAEALYEYLKKYSTKKQPLYGGIVRFKDAEWQIQSSNMYEVDTGWTKLEL